MRAPLRVKRRRQTRSRASRAAGGVPSEFPRRFEALTENPSRPTAPDQTAGASDALLELVQDAVIVRDPNDRVVYWNRAAQSLYGRSRREALGVVVHDRLRTRFPGERAEVLTTLKRPGTWDGLLRHQTRDRGEVVTWSRW